MKKKRIILIIVVCTVFFIGLIFLLILKGIKKNMLIPINAYTTHSDKKQINFNGYLKVIKKFSKGKVLVKLNNKNVKDFIIYSEKYQAGEEIKVKYTDNIDNAIINVISTYNSSLLERQKIIDLINQDATVESYKKSVIVNFYSAVYNTMETANYVIMPIKIADHYYITMNSFDYFKEYHSVYILPEIEDKIVVKFDTSFRVLSFNRTSYSSGYLSADTTKVPYSLNARELLIEKWERGNYELEVEFENRDIIRIIF